MSSFGSSLPPRSPCSPCCMGGTSVALGMSCYGSARTRSERGRLLRDRARGACTDSGEARSSPKGSPFQAEGLCTFSRRRRVHVPRPKAVHGHVHGHGSARAKARRSRQARFRSARVSETWVPRDGTVAFCELGCVLAAQPCIYRLPRPPKNRSICASSSSKHCLYARALGALPVTYPKLALSRPSTKLRLPQPMTWSRHSSGSA
jgi:hypothetical protein